MTDHAPMPDANATEATVAKITKVVRASRGTVIVPPPYLSMLESRTPDKPILTRRPRGLRPVANFANREWVTGTGDRRLVHDREPQSTVRGSSDPHARADEETPRISFPQPNLDAR